MKLFKLLCCFVFMVLQWAAVAMKYGTHDGVYWVVAVLDASYCLLCAWMGLSIFLALRNYQVTGAIRLEAYYSLACDVGSFLLSGLVLIATLMRRDQLASVLQDLFSCWNTVANRLNDYEKDGPEINLCGDLDEEVQPGPAGEAVDVELGVPPAAPPIEAVIDVDWGDRPAAPHIEPVIGVDLGVRPAAPGTGQYAVLRSYPCQGDREIHECGLCPCRFGLNLVPFPIPAPEVHPPYPVYRIG